MYQHASKTIPLDQNEWITCCPFPIQSVLGKMNEIAKHKAAIEDAETQNKVCDPCSSITAN